MNTLYFTVPPEGLMLHFQGGRHLQLVMGTGMTVMEMPVPPVVEPVARPVPSPASDFPPRAVTEAMIVELLEEYGGTLAIRANVWNIYDELATRLGLPNEARRRLTRTGEPAWRPEVGFARKNLEQRGVLEPTAVSGRGVWQLRRAVSSSVDRDSVGDLALDTVVVDALDGVPPAHESRIREAMRTCTNSQRLVVCLYLMSDRPVSGHHLSDIEHELRKIFPPAPKSHLTPDTYLDFQAAAVRFCFNMETRSATALADRLWNNPRRGYWQNTDIGNRAAVQILRDRGLVIETPLSPNLPAVDAPLPVSTLIFLEKTARLRPDSGSVEDLDL